MAGRIPQQFIDDLLARINITDIVESRVKLKRSGKNYSGLCPFHKENSPSFSVSPDKQFYYCFGCGAGGNALGFLMEYERLSFPEAVEELAKIAGVEVPKETQHPLQPQREQQLKRQFDLLELAAQHFRQQLVTAAQNHPVKTYLQQRGISPQTADAFALGYAPAGWDHLLKQFSQAYQAKPETLESIGLVVHNPEKQRFYDRFRDRLMFPIRDMRGRVIAFGGRVLNDEKPKYLNSSETDTFNKSRELYGLYEARQHNSSLQRLLIVEGYMDVVGLAEHGIHWAVATLGTATNAQHLTRLFKLVPEVIFCFDGDSAGRKAAERALEISLPIIQDGYSIRFLFLPEGEDPDSLVKLEGKEAFEARTREALPLSEFFFRHYSAEADLNSLDGRARFASRALPAIQTIPALLLKEMMRDRICEITGLGAEQLQSFVQLQQAQEPIITKAATVSTPRAELNPQSHSLLRPAFSPVLSSHKQPDLVQRVISLLLHRPDLAQGLPEAESLGSLQEAHIDLLIELINYFRANPENSLGTLLVDWQYSPSLSQHLLLLNQIAHLAPIPAEANADAEIQDAFKRLLSRQQENRLDLLLKKARHTPLSSEEKALLNQLLQQKNSGV
ncbi:DNA primase [Nitrincola tapanii]|uniref:DNA primase n=1 Tax=Nitrincola tapanii TaxID=1708751 RepID=A0A5A9VZA7_9GAMM|nr:DNA primase [Nitrincola tapanii]KAA0873564.1 DNA primase [Nitrincola tapanii]